MARPFDELSVGDDRRPDVSAVFQAYEDFAWLFTRKQFEVLALRREGLGFAEIGYALGISTSSACERAGRAQRRLEHYLKELRRERFELVRDL